MRGPYSSAVSGMAPNDAARWWRERGAEEVEKRIRMGNYGDLEGRYVNNYKKCANFTDKAGLRKPKSVNGEWYKQGSWGGKEWGI
jgi:hypothetical protein